jgi:glycerophosphoryl diester phosphodiesterase
VDRTTNARGEIRTFELEELRQLDNAYWFCPGQDAVADRPPEDYVLRGRAPVERELGVATLSEVLEAFPGVVLNLDIKRTAPEVTAYERLVADEIREHGRTDDVIVASFSDAATAEFAKWAPEVAIAAGTDATTEFYNRVQAGAPAQDDIGRYVALQPPARLGPLTVVDERFIDDAHSSGLAVHVWTVDEPTEMDHLVNIGVDGIISDTPSVLAAELGRLGANWKL